MRCRYYDRTLIKIVHLDLRRHPVVFNMEGVNVTASSQSSSCKLEICAAAYGLCDVTEKVKSLIQPEEQSLKFKASNDVFGDTWRRHRKTFVIVYRYINAENTDVIKKVAREDDTLDIRPTSATKSDVDSGRCGQGIYIS